MTVYLASSAARGLASSFPSLHLCPLRPLPRATPPPWPHSRDLARGSDEWDTTPPHVLRLVVMAQWSSRRRTAGGRPSLHPSPAIPAIDCPYDGRLRWRRPRPRGIAPAASVHLRATVTPVPRGPPTGGWRGDSRRSPPASFARLRWKQRCPSGVCPPARHLSREVSTSRTARGTTAIVRCGQRHGGCRKIRQRRLIPQRRSIATTACSVSHLSFAARPAHSPFFCIFCSVFVILTRIFRRVCSWGHHNGRNGRGIFLTQ